MAQEPVGEQHGGRVPGGRGPAHPSPRPAAIMVAAGALLAAAGLPMADERWQLVAWIIGGTAAAVGLLTIGYHRVERSVGPHLPRRRG